MNWFAAGARFGWLLFVARVVQWPYRAAYHASDDRYLQFLVGLLQTDRMGWATYLLGPLEGHFAPLWKLIYYVQWRWYGLNSHKWHINITIVHVGTAWLLYWLLLRYLKSRPAALLGATLWAAAAIGRWDNPMAWLATGQIPWSLLWLLAAMVCQSLVVETGGRRWIAGTVTCFSIAALTWGASLALSVVLPLQLWMLETAAKGGDRRRLTLLWILALGVLAIVFASVSLPQMSSTLTHRSLPTIIEVIARVIAQMSAAFAALSVWSYASDPMYGLAGKRIAAALALLLVLLLPRANRRVVAVFLGLALIHLLLVNVFRSDVSFEAAVGWGRYLYLATLAWSVVAAVALDAVLRMTRGQLAWVIVLAGGALVPLHMAHQRAIASDTMHEFVIFYEEEHKHFVRQTELLEWLDDYAGSQDTQLNVPDLPLNVEPTEGVYFPLSAFASLVAPKGLPRLTIVRGIDMLNTNETAATQTLERAESPMAPRWAQRADAVAEMLSHLTWLSQLAVETGTTYRIPDRTMRFPALSFPMTQLLGMNFPSGLPGCRVVSPDETELIGFDRELKQLANQMSEEARWWEGVFRDEGEIVVEFK